MVVTALVTPRRNEIDHALAERKVLSLNPSPFIVHIKASFQTAEKVRRAHTDIPWARQPRWQPRWQPRSRRGPLRPARSSNDGGPLTLCAHVKT